VLLCILTYNALSDGTGERPALPRKLLVWFAGLIVPFAVIGLWSWWHGALSEMIWTTFRYPLSALMEVDHHPEGLRRALRWFIDMTALWLPFTLVGALWSVREVFRRQVAGIPGVMMIVWGIVGILTIFIQYHYWWAFHFNQFFVPVGVLAGIGLTVVFKAVNTQSTWKAVPILLFTCFAIVAFSLRLTAKVSLGAQDLNHAGGVISAYVHRFSPISAEMTNSVATALNDRPEGSLYVFGDPRFLLAADRKQAVPHNGWALEIMTAAQWQRFARTLEEAHPRYVYVSRGYQDLLPRRAPELAAWLEQNYEAFYVDSLQGRWYESEAAAGD
ncbi:MAG: hypothetical protein ABW110_22290, partial [Steroidobacteraceae bacterium]